MPKLEISHSRIRIPALINIQRRRLGFLRVRKTPVGSRETVLSSKPLNPWRAREILKEKLDAVAVDSCSFTNHSFRSAELQAANLNVPDRLFKVHGRQNFDSAKDGYVCDNVDSRLCVPMYIGIQLCHFPVQCYGHCCIAFTLFIPCQYIPHK